MNPFHLAIRFSLVSFLSIGCIAEVEPIAEESSQPALTATVGACVPDCGGRTCGVDPVCGTSCGECGAGSECNDDGQCVPVCVPDCSQRTCGVDPVCGTSCGECGAGSECNDDGQCEAVCIPDCRGRTCGLDPKCGVSCGTCDDDEMCGIGGRCVDRPRPPSHCRHRRSRGFWW